MQPQPKREESPRPAETYWLTRFVILRLLGCIYAVAFLAAAKQILPLIGSHGLLPLGLFLERVQSALGSTAAGFFRLPSVFWFVQADAVLQVAAWAGFALSLVVVAGYANALVMARKITDVETIFRIQGRGHKPSDAQNVPAPQQSCRKNHRWTQIDTDLRRTETSSIKVRDSSSGHGREPEQGLGLHLCLSVFICGLNESSLSFEEPPCGKGLAQATTPNCLRSGPPLFRRGVPGSSHP